MSRLKESISKLFTKLSIYYIRFVYKTSKIMSNGEYLKVTKPNDEKYILSFWHGDSYSLYPYMEGMELYIITTATKRGDYVSMICKSFGYKPLRLPDVTEGGNFLFKVKREISSGIDANLVIALDGPLGPYHEPKSLAVITAMLTKRKIMPLTISCKRKLHLKRWDKFVVPLPFNEINLHFFEPIEVNKCDLENDSIEIRNKIKHIMEGEI